ncbi:MAG TPA: ABC transporter permease [Solirubrobacteraceae bacterium]|nr:ABC transporter permease [Solirubrobacteraceae bacterium]
MTASELLLASGTFASLRSAGEMGALAVRSVTVMVRPPYSWFREGVVETSKACRRCLIPLAISVSVFIVALSILVFGNLLHELGATDRQAGGMWIAFTREVCVWVTGMVFAGVAGSAITADLGARKIREELDALAVLGVDRFRTLVVPRVFATTIAAPVLGMLATTIVTGVNYAIAPGHLGLPPSVWRDSLIGDIIPLDLYSALIKYTIIGFFVGVVATHKGLTSQPGAEGVGRAVNQTVVITFFGVWLINTLFNLAYLTAFPQTAILRG